jgi:hypothetical protein
MCKKVMSEQYSKHFIAIPCWLFLAAFCLFHKVYASPERDPQSDQVNQLKFDFSALSREVSAAPFQPVQLDFAQFLRQSEDGSN